MILVALNTSHPLNFLPFIFYLVLNHTSDWNDTIAAIATPPGIGALGIIRISGAEAIMVADRLFLNKDLKLQPSHSLHVGFLQHQGTVLDEVVVSLYRSPRSYTGEDIAEISCHGSPYVLQKILEACLQQGARIAKPGEFTQRAFINGKLDLAQAESVADLIAANTAAAQQTALQHMRGGFSKDLQELREELIRFSSLIELELDFSQEDVEFADRTQFKKLIEKITVAVQQLLQSFKLGNAIKQGIQVAIIGPPNAGKSTLLNALLNEERAIVSEIAGTTRDSIEEILNIKGILFRLIDTAGIRTSKGDVIEDIGMERSKLNAAKADLIIYLKDMTDSNATDIGWISEFEGKTIVVKNKVDVWKRQIQAKGLVADLAPGMYISAKEQDGIELLKGTLYEKAIGHEINTENTIVTNARHYHALQQVAQSLSDIKEGMDNQLPGDLLSLDIRTCLHYLGTITGQITHEDQLDFIFSKFCIGK